jgi:hypothetical protein
MKDKTNKYTRDLCYFTLRHVPAGSVAYRKPRPGVIQRRADDVSFREFSVALRLRARETPLRIGLPHRSFPYFLWLRSFLQLVRKSSSATNADLQTFKQLSELIRSGDLETFKSKVRCI